MTDDFIYGHIDNAGVFYIPNRTDGPSILHNRGYERYQLSSGPDSNWVLILDRGTVILADKYLALIRELK